MNKSAFLLQHEHLFGINVPHWFRTLTSLHFIRSLSCCIIYNLTMPLCPLKRRMVIRSANPPNTQRCFKKAPIDHVFSHTIQVSMPYFRSDSTLEPKFQSLSSAFVVRTVERQTPMQLATVDLALAIRVKTPTRDPPSFVAMQKRSISSTIFNRIAATVLLQGEWIQSFGQIYLGSIWAYSAIRRTGVTANQ